MVKEKEAYKPTSAEVDEIIRLFQITRMKMIEDMPFYGVLLLEVMPVVCGPELPTAAINYKNFFLNGCTDKKKFPDCMPFTDLTPVGRKTVMAHEIMHLIFQHLSIWDGLNTDIANIAMDSVINRIISKNPDFDLKALPAGCVLPLDQGRGFSIGTGANRKEFVIPDFESKDWFPIYQEMMSQLEKQSGGDRAKLKALCDALGKANPMGGDVQGAGEGFDPNDPNNQQDIFNFNSKVIEVAEQAKQQGKLPAEIERWVDELQKGKISWTKYLRTLIRTTVTKNDFSYKPNSRRAHCGKNGRPGFFPRVYSESIGEVYLALDTSGCHVGDTLVSNNLGKLQAINKIFDDILSVTKFDEAKAEDKVIETIEKDTTTLVEVTTATGRKAVCTPNHHFPYLDIQEILRGKGKVKTRTWGKLAADHKVTVDKRLKEAKEQSKRIDQFKVGEYLFCSLALPNTKIVDMPLSTYSAPSNSINTKPFSIPEYYTSEVCEIIGYMIGDGCLRNAQNNYSVFATDKDGQILEAYQAKIKSSFGFDSLIRKWSRQRLNVNSAGLTKYFADNFGEGFGPSPKRVIPENLTELSDDCIAGLLRGLFDAEGHVGDHWVTFNSTSETLARQYQLLLSRLGIISHLKTETIPEREIKGHKIKATRLWRTNVGTVELPKFKALIGTNSIEKKKKMDAILTASNSTVRNTIPFSEYLFLDQIVSIETKDVPTTKVHDLCMQEIHNYTVNGIVTHNSMGRAEITEGLSEFKGLRNTTPFTLHFMSCDASAYEVKTYDITEEPDWDSMPIHGGGGTDFRPVFEVIAERRKNGCPKPAMLVYFTDGYGSFPEEAPDYPVIWIDTYSQVEYPFGKVIRIQDYK